MILSVKEWGSVRLRIVSLLAILSVIIWHCECDSSVEKWFVPIFMHWSVPWFFLVSGFFFAQSVEKYTVSSLLRKKTVSLMLPYVSWCVIGWCFWMPTVSGGICDVMLKLFGVITFFPAGNWPLWYTRALMEYMIIYAVIASAFRLVFHRHSGVIQVCAFGIVCCYLRICGFGISPFGDFLFFLAGLAMPKKYLSVRIRRWGMLSACAFMIAVALHLVALTADKRSMRFMCENLGVFAMILSLFSAVDVVEKWPRALEWILRICALSTFVYFFHGPLMRGVIRYGFGFEDGILKGGNFCFILQSIIFPTAVFAIAFVIRRISPKVYRFLSGGRD